MPYSSQRVDNGRMAVVNDSEELWQASRHKKQADECCMHHVSSKDK